MEFRVGSGVREGFLCVESEVGISKHFNPKRSFISHMPKNYVQTFHVASFIGPAFVRRGYCVENHYRV